MVWVGTNNNKQSRTKVQFMFKWCGISLTLSGAIRNIAYDNLVQLHSKEPKYSLCSNGSPLILRQLDEPLAFQHGTAWHTADLLRQPLEMGIVEFLVVSEA